jgi:hypothetical protein
MLPRFQSPDLGKCDIVKLARMNLGYLTQRGR